MKPAVFLVLWIFGMFLFFCAAAVPLHAADPLVFLRLDGSLANSGIGSAVTFGAYEKITSDTHPAFKTFSPSDMTPATPVFEWSDLLSRDVLRLNDDYFLRSDNTVPGAGMADLGLAGNTSKTVSVLMKVDPYSEGSRNASPFDLGVYGDGMNFSLRQAGGMNAWLLQQWGGAYDKGVNNFARIDKWNLYTMTYDAGTGITSVYQNGILCESHTAVLNTGEAPIDVGKWHAYFLQGQVADFQVYAQGMSAADVKQLYGQMANQNNGLYQTFESADLRGGFGADGWLASCGNSAIRATTYHDTPGRTILASYPSTTESGNPYPWHEYPYAENLNLKVLDTAFACDTVTGIAWGPIFTILDDTASIDLMMVGGGGHVGKSLNSKIDGPVGVALWDIETGKIIPGTITAPTGDGWNARPVSIDLNDPSLPYSLQGREVMLVGIDRNFGGWGWYGIESISIPMGTVAVRNENAADRVVKEWNFDTPASEGGWNGWYQLDGAGNKITDAAPTSFALGSSPGNMWNYIDTRETGRFTDGAGYLISAVNGNWDGPAGRLVSDPFELKGNVIEFMIAGAVGDGTGVFTESDRPGFIPRELKAVGFDLMIDLNSTGNFDDFVAVFTSNAEGYRNSGNDPSPGDGSNYFMYDFWDISDYAGLEAYFRLRDDSGGYWQWVAVDGIRMLDFNARQLDEEGVPEPATWGMLVLGVLAAGSCRRIGSFC